MPSLAAPYQRPGGFAYNYAVAALFAVFGESTVPIEIVQGALLGICAVWLYRLFRPRLDPVSAVIYLGLLAVFLLADQFLYNTRRLLSENLLFLLLPLFLQLVLGAYERGGRWQSPGRWYRRWAGGVDPAEPGAARLRDASPVGVLCVAARKTAAAGRPTAVPRVHGRGLRAVAVARCHGHRPGECADPHLTGDWQVPIIAIDPREPSSWLRAAQAIVSHYLPRGAFVSACCPFCIQAFGCDRTGWSCGLCSQSAR